MGKKYVRFLPILFFLVIEGLLFYMNYVPHTYLVGWDNVFSELNFKNAFKINLFSVWQQYRGLGVQDGLAHAANLIHTCFLFLLSRVLPQNLLRYVFHFFMHLLGMVGMYILLKQKFKKNVWIAILGGLFYGLNLATIQMFYAPLEVFSVHFAAIPWGILSLLIFLEKPNKKNALILLFTHVLFTPQGFVPTVFIAYLIGIFCFCIAEIIQRRSWMTIKTTAVSFIIIFIANSFWLLPFMNGAKTQGSVIQNTKINQISSEEIYQKNIKRGNLVDVLLLKGFMLDTVENGLNGKPMFIMERWNKHFDNKVVIGISYSFVFLTLVGVASLIRKKKIYPVYASMGAFICSFLLLGTDVPIASSFNEAIRRFIPLFGEAFRFPFTKLVLIFVFSYGILFIEGVELLGNILYKKLKVLLYALLFIFIFTYAFPAFSGLFFYPSIRLSIPQDYFKVISYFKKEPANTRVMTLPQSSFWNWLYYKWGERGSGFLWYGLEQATLERPFDPWSNYNEQYFNEIEYALQTENQVLFKNIVEKYDISYVLIDDNIVQTSKVQQKDKLEKFIKDIYPNSQLIGFNKLSVIKLNMKPFVQTLSPSSIRSVFSYEYTDTAYNENGDYVQNEDGALFYPFSSLFTNKTQPDIEANIAYKNNTLALTNDKNVLKLDQAKQISISFPSFLNTEKYVFARIISDKNILTIQPVRFLLEIDKSVIPYIPFQQEIFIKKAIKRCVLNDEYIDGTKVITLSIDLPNVFHCTYQDGSEDSWQFYPKLNPNQSQTVNLKKGTHQISLLFESSLDSVISNGTLSSGFEERIKQICSEELRNGISYIQRGENEIYFSAKNNSSCYDLYLPQISQRQGLLVFIRTTTISGLSLRFVVDNPQQRVNIIDTKLNNHGGNNLIILPPTSPYVYSGYGVHFRNVSLDNSPSKNSIQDMQIGAFPYTWIKSIKINLGKTSFAQNKNIPFNESNPSFYILDNIDSRTIALSQSFNIGWKAYIVADNGFLNTTFPFIFGKSLNSHVLVNNWANGWQISPADSGSVGTSQSRSKSINTNIVIIFWPQYLQYAGYIFLFGTLVTVLFWKPKKKN